MLEIGQKATILFGWTLAVTRGGALIAAQQPSQPQQPAAPQPQSAAAQQGSQPQQPAAPQPQPAAAQSPSKGCIAVEPIGSHAFRNVMLLGAAGAFISKHQYKVADVVDYPARVGQKYHGDDLHTLQGNGTKVVLLPKKYTQDELRKACH